MPPGAAVHAFVIALTARLTGQRGNAISPRMENIRSLCVYCGSSGRVDPAFKQLARAVGERLAKAGIELVYGGGKVGLMGEAADAALSAGGKVTGIIPRHLMRLEVGHGGATELIVVETMHERKMIMAERSDGFIVLPGGLGTLDETFEIATWRQLKLHSKPIIIIDAKGYWAPLRAMVDHMIAEGFVSEQHRALLRFVPDIDAAFAALAEAPEPIPGPEVKWQ
jgi:uncharacterized protein (TIGR00730 family)